MQLSINRKKKWVSKLWYSYIMKYHSTVSINF